MLLNPSVVCGLLLYFFDFVWRFFAFILSCVARYAPSSSSKNHSRQISKPLAANFCELFNNAKIAIINGLCKIGLSCGVVGLSVFVGSGSGSCHALRSVGGGR